MSRLDNDKELVKMLKQIDEGHKPSRSLFENRFGFACGKDREVTTASSPQPRFQHLKAK